MNTPLPGMPRLPALLTGLLLGLLLFNTATAQPAPRQLQASDDPKASVVWQKVHASLFEGRPIAPAPADLLVLEAPARAIDAAMVPISMRTGLAPGGARTISALYLIIDANPSPVSAIFRFTPESGRADIETRVRVDEYSHVRAIAETSDGKLYMATRFVKASGGCSAPAGSDAAAAQASLGKMRVRVDGDLQGTQPVLAQLQINHPNHSGLALDQTTRLYTPAHFVRTVEVSHAGKPVLSADLDFSISENPSLRFYFLPKGSAELKVEVTDSRGLRFGGPLSAQAPD
jgi:sulfur-oxidizing protein SoxY